MFLSSNSVKLLEKIKKKEKKRKEKKIKIKDSLSCVSL